MKNWVDTIEWDELIEEICLEKCVLVVGPDLVSFDKGQTLFQTLCQQLAEDAAVRNHVVMSPAYIFEHEELLQLGVKSNGENRKPTLLYPFYQKFYQSLTQFDEPFAKIARMPFHLIISLLPDRRLSGKFEEMKRSRSYQFEYYNPTGNQEIKIKFSKDNPLIYNILGTIDPPTCIITFNHLFDYLSGILGANKLPVKLKASLDKATSFIFLGVHFEKWYMQILLRIFTPQATLENPISKYSLLQAEQANDACTFIANRLQLEFLPVKPIDFLNELYKRFEGYRSSDNKCRLISPPSPASVFVSYSHANNTGIKSVTQVVEKLKEANIEVIIDDESLAPGDRISQFMERVKDVDKVVAILSEHSLQSPYVCFEIMYSLKNNRKLVPCYLDKRFAEADFASKIQSRIREEIRKIIDLIKERQEEDPLDPADDLRARLKLWQDFGRDLGELFEKIQNLKCISLLPADWDTGIETVIKAILA